MTFLQLKLILVSFGFLFFTRKRMTVNIPNDPGREVEIDGVKTSLINSGGLILMKVPAGDHRNSFKYHTPGLLAGTVISVVSVLLFAVLGVYGRRSRR